MKAELIKSINYLPGYQSIIGKQYIPEDNSYVADQLGRWANLYGAKTLAIISTPYKATLVSNWSNQEYEETFVNVLDIATGIRYRVLFVTSWVQKSYLSVKVDPDKIINHQYKVKDNSYIGEIVRGTLKSEHCNLIGNPNLVIVDIPRVGEGKGVLGDKFSAYWIVVKDRKTDKHYRVPYYPGGVSELKAPEESKKVIYAILAL